MSKKINIIIGAVIFFILVLFSLSFSEEQDEGETFTITTYYPSPYGVYKELRLYPNISPNPCDSNSNNKGAMYYNDSDNQVYVCNGTAWKTLGSGCPDVPGANQNNCWLDVDGDGFTPKTGDCDETCANCYVGSTTVLSLSDNKDQNCNGRVDELSGVLSKSCTSVCGGNSNRVANTSTIINACKTYCTSLNLPYEGYQCDSSHRPDLCGNANIVFSDCSSNCISGTTYGACDAYYLDGTCSCKCKGRQ